jgi:hypothetical protein
MDIIAGILAMGSLVMDGAAARLFADFSRKYNI